VARNPLAEGRWSEMARVLADRYAFKAWIGEGGAGAVFEVVNLALGRTEALKVLTDRGTEDAGERFANEARVAASLDHPRIVKIYEFGQEEGWLWYSMQLVDGPTLATILDAGVRLSASGLAQVAVPLLDALAYSHQRGVVHRDIKPANILFSLQGRPFLTDYGIAKAMESPLDTRTGQVLGTPAYLAPEQALGEAVDARADLYALGVSLYRAASGVLPFQADGVMQTLLVRLREDPPPLEEGCPDLPPQVAGVIMKALARDRESRWESASAMKEALLEACAAAGIPWEGPLEAAAAFTPQRKPLSQAVRDLVPAGSETTADLPLPRPRRWARWAIPAVLAAGGALFLLGRRPRLETLPRATSAAHRERPAAEPHRAPAPSLPAPAAKVPAVAAAPPPPAPAPPAAATLRRPVVYPQLLGEGILAASPAPGCAGRTVNVSLVVGEDGRVIACKVLGQVDPACGKAAREAALRCRFKPALDAWGQPVEATLAVAVEFPEAP
jgi:hypothetical protein